MAKQIVSSRTYVDKYYSPEAIFDSDITGESVDLELDPSVVKPSESLSLEEILFRFRTGRSVTIQQPVNVPEEFSFDMSKLDKMDVEELKIENIKNIRKTQEALERINEAKTKAEMREAVAEELQKVTAQPSESKDTQKQ